jgi:hypothetical protein
VVAHQKQCVAGPEIEEIAVHKPAGEGVPAGEQFDLCLIKAAPLVDLRAHDEPRPGQPGDLGFVAVAAAEQEVGRRRYSVVAEHVRDRL